MSLPKTILDIIKVIRDKLEIAPEKDKINEQKHALYNKKKTVETKFILKLQQESNVLIRQDWLPTPPLIRISGKKVRTVSN